jgi:hypothetical protein
LIAAIIAASDIPSKVVAPASAAAFLKASETAVTTATAASSPSAASAAKVASAVALIIAASYSALEYVLSELDVSSLDPHAANDRAIRETPPARAVFEFFCSQAVTSLFTSELFCLSEAFISLRNAPVVIMFILFAPYKTVGKIPCQIFSQLHKALKLHYVQVKIAYH